MEQDIHKRWHDFAVTTGSTTPYIKQKRGTLLQHGTLILCLALPPVCASTEYNTFVTPQGYATISQVAQITEWAAAATSPTLPKSPFNDLNNEANPTSTSLDEGYSYLGNEFVFLNSMTSWGDKVAAHGTIDESVVNSSESESLTYKDLSAIFNETAMAPLGIRDICFKAASAFDAFGIEGVKTYFTADDSILFELFHKDSYFSLEVFDDGDIVYLSRQGDSNALAYDISPEDIYGKIRSIHDATAA
ncbi:hypothetical protein [Hymenobacter ruricola]|uniref:Uncharacterized protein n=1 Tax=Hymenobacter ruricola TaxID=2791023 RepID=A0ABS0I4B6_9BACT|nr:hypothetical protein [Hymenobacter ruricola]MBF9221767.1 hypothetical protein [Hymenobacter ruricola]